MRRMALLPAALVVVLATGAVTTGRSEAAQSARVQRHAAHREAATQVNTATQSALDYLKSHLNATGAFTGDGAATAAQYAIAAAGAGMDPNQLRLAAGDPSVADYLATQLTSLEANPAPKDAGTLAMVVQGLVAANRLRDTTLRSAVVTLEHEAASAASTYDEALALQALEAAGQRPATSLISGVKSLQQPDGGWEYSPGWGSDTNTTAQVLMALDASGDHSADKAALGFLRQQQNSDAGFPYQGPAASDADSTALVIQALVAAGQDPTGCAWAKGGQTPMTALASFQVTSGASRGAYVGYNGPDAFTTAQVPMATMLTAYPFGGALERADAFLQTHRVDDLTVRLYGALDLEAAGYDPSTAISYLRAHSSDIEKSTARLALMIQVLHGAGSPLGTLPADLTGSDHYDAATGAFISVPGSTSVDAFTQSFAIQALVSAQQAVPAKAIGVITGDAGHPNNGPYPDSGWSYGLSPADNNGSDSNSTALVIMALASLPASQQTATVSGEVDAAFTYLDTLRTSDGGYQDQPGWGSDPDSTALVAQALSTRPSRQSDLDGAIGYLLAQQAPSGGYVGYSGSPDAFTTSQVPMALLKLAFPAPSEGDSRLSVGSLGAVPSYASVSFASGCASGTMAPPLATSPAATTTTVKPVAPSQPRRAAVVQQPVAAATPTPAATATPSPAATPAPSPTAGVQAISTAPPVRPSTPAGGGLPVWTIYLLALIGAAVLVSGGGAVLLRARR